MDSVYWGIIGYIAIQTIFIVVISEKFDQAEAHMHPDVRSNNGSKFFINAMLIAIVSSIIIVINHRLEIADTMLDYVLSGLVPYIALVIFLIRQFLKFNIKER